MIIFHTVSLLYPRKFVNQIPRSKLTVYRTSSAASCGVSDPRDIRQISAQMRLLGLLPTGIKADPAASPGQTGQNLYPSKAFLKNTAG